MPDEDITKELLEGPEKIIEIMDKKDENKKEPLSYIKTYKTFLFDNDIRATIYSSDDPTSSKFSGSVEWIGDRRGGGKGSEFFIRSRDEGKVFSLGLKNIKSCKYNPQRRSFNIVQSPLTCPVCNKPVEPQQDTISCPNCHITAHKAEFLEYLKLHSVCPACKARLTMKGK